MEQVGRCAASQAIFPAQPRTTADPSANMQQREVAHGCTSRSLASEFSPGRVRGRMAGNIMAAFPVGLVIAAALSLFIIPRWGWRALFVVGVLPAVLLFFVHRYMPESVRYLLSKGRVDEAEKTVEQIERQAIGRSLSPDEIKTLGNIRPEVGTEVKVTVAELLAPGRIKNTLLLWVVSFGFLWASNGILFMLPTILQQRGFPLTQAITFQLVQAITAVFGYSACSFLIDGFGRRPVLFLYYFIGAFCHLWFALASGMWLYFAAAAVGWVNPGVYGAIGIYVSELHPTHLRATAVGGSSASAASAHFLRRRWLGSCWPTASALTCCTPLPLPI